MTYMAEEALGLSPAAQYIEELKAGRDRPAVLKTRLAVLRSALPQCIVVAFEGFADKSIYAQWIRRVNFDLVFEPFPCDGKEKVFAFREMLDRDLGGLERGVYFIVDRDFDDLAGRELGDKTYMTDRYSIENYLVEAAVLGELLKNEFHCHTQPQIRAKVIEHFERLLQEFNAATKEINFRIFLARKLGIKVQGGLPKRAKDIASIALLGVGSRQIGVDQIVVLAREPTVQEVDDLRPTFDALDAPTRYRGKFLIIFFMKWLDLLAADRARDKAIMFKGIDRRKTVKLSEISAALLATRSPLPVGFSEFVQSMAD